MQLERFAEILDAYGGNDGLWPAEERAGMLDLLEEDDRARQMLLAARELDQLLDSYQPELPDLSVRIMAAVPESLLDRFLNWLWPRDGGQWWHPALASALPLVLGLAIGISQPVAGTAAEEQDSWELQERYLLLPSGDGAAGDWYD